uniref:SUEL-type lectin domain-containing protein n=1 Tax=Fundulus heteroclitus TaxID=8078 RepID=A0A3Q2PQA7_FUNHE
ERSITCDDSSSIQRLSCDNGAISVQSALYGGGGRHICSEGRSPQQIANTEYSLTGFNCHSNRCDGKRVCEFNPADVRSFDPCEGIATYLETNYTCIPASQSSLNEYGQVIFVYGADYGRRDHTTCSYRRPASQIENVYLSTTTGEKIEKIEDCNGKNSCTIQARNSVFGDPCVGTFKYLEVAYTCECE